MDAVAFNLSFSQPNPHALATILEASETRSIIASQDIFDASGIKLWARDRPVSQDLQRKLLDRHLRQPLEACLEAEDGVTPVHLAQAAVELAGGPLPLAAVVRPWVDRLEYAAAHLPLHPVAKLLLTMCEVSRSAAFDHAIQAMCLNGMLTLEHGGDPQALQLAMLCGLLHDIGEMYIDPRHGEADADRDLDVRSYQQLVVHPHVGRLLIEQLTDYPPSVGRAIAEHHERLDGSGYPHCLRQDQVSPMGRQLAVTEAALGAMRSPPPNLARSSVALRVIPGEFDLGWVGELASAANGQRAPARRAIADIQARLGRLDTILQGASDNARALMSEADSVALKEALTLASYLLARLRTGWNASGLWSHADLDVQDSAEVEAIEDELALRLRGIERAARLRAGTLPAGDQQLLDRLCLGIGIDTL